MASHATPPLRYRTNIFLSEPLQFRRKDKKPKPKKMVRRIKVKFSHIFLCFLLISGLFVFVQRAYLFLISWDKLNVDHIEVSCQKERIAEDVRQFLEGRSLGNLMILDIHALKAKLVVHPWIKDVRVRKTFPSVLKIAILERQPYAIMKSHRLFLIDREGIKLQETDFYHHWDLPLFVDDKNFLQNSEEKLNLAWAFLESLDPSVRALVDTVDLTEYENVKVKLKDSPTWLVLGEKLFFERVQFYLAQEAFMKQFGPLEYVDLRFEERMYIKPQTIFAKDFSSSIAKEGK